MAYADGAGELGVISSVTRAFCRGCSRARVSTDGQLYTCLFAGEGHDLRALLRQEADDTRIVSTIAHLWEGRADRYSELRTANAGESHGAARPSRAEMSYIGG